MDVQSRMDVLSYLGFVIRVNKYPIISVHTLSQTQFLLLQTPNALFTKLLRLFNYWLTEQGYISLASVYIFPLI